MIIKNKHTMENYLYILQRKNSLTIKIGCSQNFKNRICSYITPESMFDNTTHDIWLFKIIESEYDCYQLDKLIQDMSSVHNIPYRKFYGTGGKEHYHAESVNNLCNFLTKIGVAYEVEKLDINEYRKEINYESEIDNPEVDYNKKVNRVKLSDEKFNMIEKLFSISGNDEIKNGILNDIETDNESNNSSDSTNSKKINKKHKNKVPIIDIIHEDIVPVPVSDESFYRYGQQKAYEAFVAVLMLVSYWGLLLAPTAWGKSFVHLLYIAAYLYKFQGTNTKPKNIILMSMRVDVCRDLCSDMKTEIKKLIKKGRFPNIKYEIVDQYTNWDIDMINKDTGITKIIIINTSKLIISKKGNKNGVENKLLHQIDWGKIGFCIFDEVHWAGSTTICNVMKYIKDKKVEYCIGSSATPFRESLTSQKNLKELFTENSILNKIYELGYIEAWENKVICPIDHIYFKVSKNNVIIEDNEGVKKYTFKDEAKKQIMDEVLECYKKSIYKKIILYFSSRKSALDWHKFIKNNKYFDDCKLFVSFSISGNDDIKKEMANQNLEITGNEINDFKKCGNNAVLFVVFQATEGFNDPKVDIVANMDFVEDRSIGLLLQKIGRTQRILFENRIIKKQKGYYLAPMLEESEEDMKTKLCDALTDYIKILAKENKDGRLEIDKKTMDIITKHIEIKGIDNFDAKMIIDRIIKNSSEKMTLDKFVTVLKNNNIKTKDEYYEFIENDKNDYLNLPFVIETVYPEFVWGKIDNDDKYYEEEEIVDKLRELYKNNKKSFDGLGGNHRKIINKISELDDKIPSVVPWKHYQLNKEQFNFLFE